MEYMQHTQPRSVKMFEEICLHEDVTKEVLMGIRTGDKKCTKCGALFASAKELKEARAAAAVLKKNQTPKEVCTP